MNKRLLIVTHQQGKGVNNREIVVVTYYSVVAALEPCQIRTKFPGKSEELGSVASLKMSTIDGYNQHTQTRA